MPSTSLPAPLLSAWARTGTSDPDSIQHRIATFASRCRGRPKAVKAAVNAELGYLRGKYALATIPSLLTGYRKALRAANPNHPALQYLALTDDEITELRQDALKRVSKTQRSLRPVNNPIALIAKARAIIANPGRIEQARRAGALRWHYIAAGLALLTGRRPAELLRTGEFAPVKGQRFMMQFRGQAKTRGAPGTQTGWYEIPVLAPASEIIRAVRLLRSSLPATRGMTNADVHSKWKTALGRAVRAVFGAQWSPYDFRAVYALCCYHAFAPRNVAQLAYYADILGHRLLAAEQPGDKSAAVADTMTAAFYLRFYLPKGVKRLHIR